jgi:hypothetical protein
MKKDLLLAILAMDSYNRGYGQHIIGMGELVDAQGPIKLGNVEVLDQSNILDDSTEFEVGF